MYEKPNGTGCSKIVSSRPTELPPLSQVHKSPVVQSLGTTGAIWRSNMRPINPQKTHVRQNLWSTLHFESNKFPSQKLQENMNLHMQYCKEMAIILGFSSFIALTFFVMIIS